MSASATSASASLPTVQQLLNAVHSDATPIPAIQALFVSTLDTIPSEAVRIADARRVYQIVQTGKPSLAVFYKLEDPKKVAEKTSEAFYKVLAKAIKRPTNYEALMEEINFFKEESDKPAERLVAEEMLRVLSDHMHKHQKTDVSLVNENEIRQLFGDIFKTSLVNISIDSFFTFPDRTVAGKIGALYDPSNNQTHNWGVNAVWTAALAARKTAISILSPLLPESGVHPSNTPFTPGSSAFALEIAIAIKMGYIINFSPPDKAKLLPPSEPNLSVTLPTREEQTQIYAWCCSKRMEAIKQFKDASVHSSDITYSYAAPSTSVSSTATATKAEVSHTPSSSFLNQFKLHQSKATAVQVSSAAAPDPNATNNQKPSTLPTNSNLKPHQ